MIEEADRDAPVAHETDRVVTDRAPESGRSALTERLELLANVLFVAAGLVFVLSLITALVVGSSGETLVLFREFERQSRTFTALATLGGGITAAGILAGLAGILKALIRRDDL